MTVAACFPPGLMRRREGKASLKEAFAGIKPAATKMVGFKMQ